MNSPCDIPPLRLRTAYTQKGLNIGLGVTFGFLAFGPVGALAGAYLGWLLGNRAAIRAEEEFVRSCKEGA